MLPLLKVRLKLRHVLAVGGIVLVVATGAGTLAANVRGLFAVGSVRMASAASSTFVSVSGTDQPAALALSTSITIPSGKVADIQATFAATVSHGSGTYAYCFAEFSIDSVVPDTLFKPGKYQLIGGATASQPDQLAAAITGFRKNIGPGTHTVSVFVSSAYSGCTLQERALNVLVNIR